MTVKMNTTIQMERYQWILPIIEKRLTYDETLKVCPHGKRSLERWVALYKEYGIQGLIPKSTQPKTQPNETPIRIKEEVVTLRNKTKLCAKKLHWRFKKEGLHVPVSTIGKILKDEGLVRKYRVKKVKYKYLRAERIPGELVEIDVKYVPGRVANKRYYQYTAIDTASRWRYLRIYDEQSTYHSILFLKEVMQRFPHPIQAIKTDNGSVFTNYYLGTNKRSDLTVKEIHVLDKFCGLHNIVHYLIDPGKPAQNGTVERSHREDQEKFYERNKFKNKRELEKKIRTWNEYYNNLEHCGLDGKTPNEVLYA
jgi:transposase InsO family protein